jgi:NAD(P)H-dependent nitrite reductase small subunit
VTVDREAEDRGRWIEVARVEDFRPGEGRIVVAEGRRLALFNDGGEFFAIDDTCPHQGASLAAGLLHAGRVICPWHSWVFELRTGRCPRDSHPPVASYRVRQNGGAIEVELPRAPA